MARLKILIAAGGTGGHLWPAVSLAQAILKKKPDSEFLFLGTGRPIEEKILKPLNFEHKILKTTALKGEGVLNSLKALFLCFTATIKAIKIINEFKPHLCFAAGGYVSVPLGLAAKLKNLPLIIHEQNSRPGLSNKVLGHVAKKIILGFQEAESAFPAGKTVFTGNPVRAEIKEVGLKEKIFNNPSHISITGGSQGALGLNRLVLSALIKLKSEGFKFKVFHQTGAKDLAWIRKTYEDTEINAECYDFYQDMPKFYERSDLVIARAGALTIAELTAAALPAILVPLPTAADDHQSINAAHMEKTGAALVISEKGSAPEDLSRIIKELLTDENKLKKMSLASLSLANFKVDEEMARICLDEIGIKN